MSDMMTAKESRDFLSYIKRYEKQNFMICHVHERVYCGDSDVCPSCRADQAREKMGWADE